VSGLLEKTMSDNINGRLSPPHLQMLWESADFAGPGDVQDLVAEVRRLRESMAKFARVASHVVHCAQRDLRETSQDFDRALWDLEQLADAKP
jgi:hypothetical protein